jgi:hypothetical protein
MEPLSYKVQRYVVAAFNEAKFWAEVIGECCGWTESPYQWVFDQHERDKVAKREEERVDQERKKFNKIS